MFELTTSEFQILMSQFATSSWGGFRKLPFAFTEQGVAMLSAVLRSKTAIQVSIHIMEAFVKMRHFIKENAELFSKIETKLLTHDNQIQQLFTLIETEHITPKQGIFYDGQIFEAYSFVSDLIRTANHSIQLIDNYIDDSVLTLLTKRQQNVKVIIYTKEISKQLALDIKKHNEQYEKIELKEFTKTHDRFLIIDNKEVYHIGASLKDLGKKWFAFSKFDKKAVEILSKM
jgi:hypothetical protein